MIKKEMAIGLLIGLLSNGIGIVIYILLFSELNIIDTLKSAHKNEVLGSLIALGATLNLAVFFLFLRQNKLYRSRGVLLATLIAAIYIAISKLN